MRTTITLDDEVAELARKHEINISAAAREGVEEAIRRARDEADRRAYLEHPEHPGDAEKGDPWEDSRAWID